MSDFLATFLPFFSNPASGNDAVSNAALVVNLIQSGLTLLFMGVVLIAVVYSAVAGFKYVQSQGASDKVEEAQGALKSVLIGVGAAFVGVMGVIIISSIFSDTGANSIRNALECYLGDFSKCSSAGGGGAGLTCTGLQACCQNPSGSSIYSCTTDASSCSGNVIRVGGGPCP